MGRHNDKPESTAPIRLPRQPPPRTPPRLTITDFLTWPMVSLAVGVALVLGVMIGILIS